MSTTTSESKRQNWTAPFTTPTRLTVLGLDASGKTTLLHTLAAGPSEIARESPALALNLEILQSGSLTLTALDVGASAPGGALNRIDAVVRANADGVVFVVGCRDPWGTYASAVESFERHALGVDAGPVLLAFNEWDVEDASVAFETVERDFGAAVDRSAPGRPFAVRRVNVKTGQGWQEGMEWMAGAIKR